MHINDFIEHRVTSSRIEFLPFELRIGIQQTQVISFLRQIPPLTVPPPLQLPPQDLYSGPHHDASTYMLSGKSLPKLTNSSHFQCYPRDKR